MRFEDAIRDACIRYIEPALLRQLKGRPVSAGLDPNSFELFDPGLVWIADEVNESLASRPRLRLATAGDLPAFAKVWNRRDAVVVLDPADDGYAPGLMANGHGTALVRFNTRVAFDETKVLCVKI